ncbi:coil containing protein [Vibrio phage 1.216.O._10N.222.55.C12]|nr:coil containing protein [Vibrio phage 1.216.O._10N.222.55.C12]
MIEVKMSDVFNLPVDVRDDLIFFSKSDTCYVKVESVLSRKEELEVSSAIRRAVNNHDRLQQENAELRDFLKMVADADSASNEAKSFMAHTFIYNAKRLLNKNN